MLFPLSTCDLPNLTLERIPDVHQSKGVLLIGGCLSKEAAKEDHNAVLDCGGRLVPTEERMVAS